MWEVIWLILYWSVMLRRSRLITSGPSLVISQKVSQKFSCYNILLMLLFLLPLWMKIMMAWWLLIMMNAPRYYSPELVSIYGSVWPDGDPVGDWLQWACETTSGHLQEGGCWWLQGPQGTLRGLSLSASVWLWHHTSDRFSLLPSAKVQFHEFDTWNINLNLLTQFVIKCMTLDSSPVLLVWFSDS